MLETFQARVNAGMEATVNGEDACPCSIFPEITGNGDLMNFLYSTWNGALVGLVEYLPAATLGKIEPSDMFGGEAGEVVERLANGPQGSGGPGSWGEVLRHVIVLAAAAGHAAALDTLDGVEQSQPQTMEDLLAEIFGDDAVAIFGDIDGEEHDD